MDRLQRLARFWNWLPAFRAVAETEHVHAAARRLCVSPSALSRTVRLLEADVGEALFRRVGRTLQLTDAGHELLSATRSAMGRIDAGLEVICGTKWAGTVRIASDSRLATVFLLPALRRLRARYPSIVPHLISASVGDAVVALQRGELDMAVVHEPLPHEGVERVVLCDASHGIYCGVGHPLHDAQRVTLEMIAPHAFAAPEPGNGAPSADNWPAELPRRVGLYSAVLDGGIEPCVHGELLVVFPDALVPTFACASRLRRLPIEIVPARRLHALKRRSLSTAPGPVDMLIADLRADVTDAAA
jgi:DNA-binding transcriptional LysR family regulator